MIPWWEYSYGGNGMKESALKELYVEEFRTNNGTLGPNYVEALFKDRCLFSSFYSALVSVD
jgi:hypothetical protein